MPKKVLVALPPKLLTKIDHIAETEHRTRSDLIREALRRYEDAYDLRQRDKGNPTIESSRMPIPAGVPCSE